MLLGGRQIWPPRVIREPKNPGSNIRVNIVDIVDNVDIVDIVDIVDNIDKMGLELHLKSHKAGRMNVFF